MVTEQSSFFVSVQYICFLLSSLVLFNTLILGFFFLITGTIFNKIVKFVCVPLFIFKGWRAFTQLTYGVT